jgi:predicted Zn finger-like uncharacterized protein
LIVQCEKCATRFRLDPERMPQAKVRARCFRCQHVFDVVPPGPAAKVPEQPTPAERSGEPATRAGNWEEIAAEDAFSFDDWASDLASELATDTEEPGAHDPLDLDPLDADASGPLPELLATGPSLGLAPAGPDSGPLLGDTRPTPSGPLPFPASTERLVPPSGGAFEGDLDGEPDALPQDAGPEMGNEPWAPDELSGDTEDPLGDLFDDPAQPDETLEPPEPAAAVAPERSPQPPMQTEAPSEEYSEAQTAEGESSALVWDYSGARRSAPVEPAEVAAQPEPREPVPQPALVAEPKALEEPASLARPLAPQARRARLLGRAATLALSAAIVASSLALQRMPARSGEVAFEGWVAQELRGRWVENGLAGPLFVVSGTLVNTSGASRAPARLRAVLLDADGAPLPGASALVGAPIPRARLRSEEPASLTEEREASPWQPDHRTLAPDAALPFEAFFVAVPPGAERFVLEPEGGSG